MTGLIPAAFVDDWLLPRLAPILEIAILSLIVYLIISFMRGTRGAGIARGLTVVYGAGFILVLFAVRFFHLENISWIMENLVGVSVIALVVIFQPEFRRGLIRLGEEVAFRFFRAHAGTLDRELADAAFSISKRGEVGALFVIEREIQLGSYIESGVAVDAVVTARLLVTIFTRNTPLHDGAVILRQGRLVAANCLLPLSENVEVCRGMGTRHRAAVGVTEESDAVVVVVSEETGAVSLAMNGQITRDLDYEGLRELLREHCFQAETEEAPEEVVPNA
jgi:diadenylate cyclase